MIDSVLKGTGNSRFLKSAVPAGTSWADALAMLQAGTFPIDFNGINTEGFQQVGTPLNKANLLKDATAAQIGLPPSTTPDGMFQALGNTGELHVWRKTVTTAQEIPAGYKLVPVAMASTILMYLDTGSVTSSTPVLYYATEINISNNGNVAIESNGKLAGWYGNGTTTISNYVPATGSGYTSITDNDGLQNLLRGKFITLVNDSNSFQLPAYVSRNKIYQIPSDATISFYHGYSLEGNSSVIVTASKLNEVVGYPLTPAGTTTTYPVSTNPNAYQEGDDAKAAGYVLGDVKTGSFKLRPATNDSTAWNYGTALNVAKDGTTTISDRQQITLTTSSTVANANVLKGKFVKPLAVTPSPFVNGQMYFIPADATISKDGTLLVNKYQVVTGYAAIPAGTTIEYLGKLGDKARVQVLSYVGTGTYGSSNPNSLTFDFVPKLLLINSDDKSAYYICLTLFGTMLTGTYEAYSFFDASGNMGYPDSSYARKNGKNIQWYSLRNAYVQANGSGLKYTAIAIG